jgi:hypothetical protein
MAFFENWTKRFAKKNHLNNHVRNANVVPGEQGQTRHGDFYEYVFNPRAQPQPGQAYMSPLLRFTEYPENRIEGNRGSGVAVQRFFKSHEPLTVQVANVPVPAGGSGTIAGQFYSQPLTDTSAVS